MAKNKSGASQEDEREEHTVRIYTINGSFVDIVFVGEFEVVQGEMEGDSGEASLVTLDSSYEETSFFLNRSRVLGWAVIS